MFDNLSSSTEMLIPSKQEISNNRTPSPVKASTRIIPRRDTKVFNAMREQNDKTPSSKEEQGPFNMQQMREVVADTEKDLVYFPVEVKIDELKDWEAALATGERDDKSKPKGALVSVNNTSIAIFKYGDSVVATSAKCPHAGGPLHLGDIEMLPDKSLCVKCPWHKWAFCVGKKEESGVVRDARRNLFGRRKGEGECVWPGGDGREGVKVFPAIVDKKRKNVKIGFENFDLKTLVEENF